MTLMQELGLPMCVPKKEREKIVTRSGAKLSTQLTEYLLFQVRFPGLNEKDYTESSESILGCVHTKSMPPMST